MRIGRLFGRFAVFDLHQVNGEHFAESWAFPVVPKRVNDIHCCNSRIGASKTSEGITVNQNMRPVRIGQLVGSPIETSSIKDKEKRKNSEKGFSDFDFTKKLIPPIELLGSGIH
jgi:hypothetical protein